MPPPREANGASPVPCQPSWVYIGLRAPVCASRRSTWAAMRSSSRATTPGSRSAKLSSSSGSRAKLYSSTSGLKWKSGSRAWMSFHSGVRQPCLAHPGRLGQVELALRDERLAPRQRHQAAAVELQPRIDAQQIQHRRRHVLGLHPGVDPRAGRHLPGSADDQRHHQVGVVQAVVVVPALVLVQGLAMIGGEHHHGVLGQAELVEHREQPADRRVHVGDRPVVEAVDEFGVGDLARKPRAEVAGERRERIQAVQRVVGRVELVSLVEEAVERGRRQVRAVRVHVPQEQEERIVAAGYGAQVRDRDLVEGVRLGHAAGLVPPAVVLQVGLEASGGRIAGEAHAAGRVAGVLQDPGQHRRGHVALVAQPHHAGAEAVAAGEHRRVGRRGRHARAERMAEHGRLLREAGDVRGGQPVVAVEAHAVAPQAVDRDQQQVRPGPHQRAPSAFRQALR